MVIRDQIDLIRKSGVFDEDWYRREYGDVPEGIDALEHYVRIGKSLGRHLNDGTPPAPKETTRTDGIVFAPTSPSFPSANEIGLVSVIVPVHNALEDVQECLQSLVKHTFSVVELIVVNDGSELETSTWLEDFARKNEHVHLVRHVQAKGYTLAVNAGAEAANGDFLVILNSDTVVPPFWLERLCAPMLVDKTVAATGPLSNAATWQSVPEIKGADGGWAVNEIPSGLDYMDIDRATQRFAHGLIASKVDLLNGFCYAIRKSVFDRIGGLDGGAFPSGYGEETDLFLKVRDLGYELRVLPNLYVYHAKSKSFGPDRRKSLSKRGNEVLYERYGKDAIQQAASTLQTNATLSAIRSRLQCFLRNPPPAIAKSFKIAFLLPVRPGGGGVHSVVQEAEGLADLGHHTSIIVPAEQIEKYQNFYPHQMSRGLFETFQQESELASFAARVDVVVATHFRSVALLKPVREAYRDILFMYYVQDYEPWITVPNSEAFSEAYASYGEIHNNVLIAKTNWICRMVEQHHAIKVNKIVPSIEHSIYNLDAREERGGAFRVTAMLRPNTPRRGAQATVDLLYKLSRAKPNVEIDVFGCGDPDLKKLNIPSDLNLRNHNVLVREKVAALLKKSDLFIDMSTYQAFGRTAVEAMACGSVAVIPENGGGGEYSMDGRAALPVPTHDVDGALKRIIALLDDPDNYELMRQTGIKVASQFQKRKAALSIEQVILQQIHLRP